MTKIRISKKAQTFLRKVPQKHARQMKAKLESLRVDRTPHDSKQLIGYPSYHRVDSGEYRIIYRITDESIDIVLAGKRNDGDVYLKDFSF